MFHGGGGGGGGERHGGQKAWGAKDRGAKVLEP